MAQLCGAKAKSTGKPCTRPVVKGANRCRFHGGAAPQVKAAAKRRLAVEQAAEALKTFGLPRTVDPRDALLEEVYRTAGAVDWLHQQVQALTPDEVIWGVPSRWSGRLASSPASTPRFGAGACVGAVVAGRAPAPCGGDEGRDRCWYRGAEGPDC